MFDLKQHLMRQMAFSHATFGPGKRTSGVVDHIRKELTEVQNADNYTRPLEWSDVVILALDGLTRDLSFSTPVGMDLTQPATFASTKRRDPNEVADEAIQIILAKHRKNEARDWPDWRQSDPSRAIEHKRTQEDTSAVRAAAQALIADVKERHPGEDLHCPHMRALDEALQLGGTV